MQVFHSFQEIKDCDGAIVALGTFDGVHLGHQKVMRTAMEKAAVHKVKSIVVTFESHPLSVLCPDKEPPRLATVEQKEQYIADVGIDALVLLPVTKHLLDESPEEFCQQILDYIHPLGIVVGSNFTYGKKAAGNTASLTAFMGAYGVDVNVLHLLERPGRAVPISSTVIRRLVLMGHMETTAALLGRPFEVTGKVVVGDRRGHLIGFPTANMLIPTDMALPPDGVYITELGWDGTFHQAMTNIGANPTFANQYRRIETHILSFQGNIYDKKVVLRFLKRLRPEMQFDSTEDLVREMKSDESKTINYFQSLGLK
ncbi:MAG: bifunctional riboflavin kinase/FAD synthetase [Megasphaera sp.]|jgi:riboflavin kinase/FMN adenylyltransferase|nr:bifunctional riboflavin kinase/FAD synthetase [Megasphaera sp.]MCI1247797.1 bifunctional riboflavin kinase/FAD synthetase [Megasphaera sp.]